MTPEEIKGQRANDIFAGIVQTKDNINAVANQLHYMRKKPRICRKERFNLRKYQALQVQLPLAALFGAIRIATIMSQPLPKLKQGGVINGQVGP